jgi:cytoskeleton protein RodZ
MAKKSTDPISTDKVEYANMIGKPTQDVYQEVADNASARDSNCGSVLRATREKQGLAVTDIASRLKLSIKQIQALEADQFSVLPEATIVRGFIRNYAKILKIAPEPLLAAYHQLVPEKAPMAFTIKPTSNMRVSDYQKPKTGRLVALGLAILLGLSTWFFYKQYVQKPKPLLPTVEQPASNVGDQAQDAGETLPQAALPAAEREISTTPATTANTSEIALPNNTPTAAPAAAPVVPAQPAAVPLPTPVSESPTVDKKLSLPDGMTRNVNAEPQATANNDMPISEADGSKLLAFSADQETWISVTDKNGKVILDKILFAGGRESIKITSPVKITVGNARATELNVNGKPLALAPYARNNVAHIKVD